jgi:hypothetical protein
LNQCVDASRRPREAIQLSETWKEESWIASSFALRATADAVVASAPRKKLALGKAAATIKTVVARLDRAIQYAAASHLSQTSLEYWVARSSRAMTAVFVSFIRVGSKVGTELAMTVKNNFALAARGARGLPEIFRPLRSEGAGNAGCALHPRSRVQNSRRKRTRAYRFSGGNPTFPAQWLYGLLRALPGDEFVLSPSLAN